MPIFQKHQLIAQEEECPVVLEGPADRYYAYTLRRTKNPHTLSRIDYVNHLNKLRSKGLSIKSIVYENTGGLHVHGVIAIPNEYNFKLLRVRGWHLYLKELFDSEGWKQYLLKEEIQRVLTQHPEMAEGG